jgi:hypothetical protein
MQDQAAIGTFAWMQATHGKLTWPERIRLLSAMLLPNVNAMWRTWTGQGMHRVVNPETLSLPDSVAVRHALAEADDAVSPSVFQHSVRTYLWAAALGAADALNFDAEFLMVASLMHDLGMSEHMHHTDCACFAGHSAHAAKASMLRFKWSLGRADRLANIISLHMNGHVPWAPGEDMEAHLLQQGAAFDVLGARWHDLDAGFKIEVLRRHPRLGFNRVFADFMASERRLRPDSRAALMHSAGLSLMMKCNPFEE